MSGFTSMVTVPGLPVLKTSQSSMSRVLTLHWPPPPTSSSLEMVAGLWSITTHLQSQSLCLIRPPTPFSSSDFSEENPEIQLQEIESEYRLLNGSVQLSKGQTLKKHASFKLALGTLLAYIARTVSGQEKHTPTINIPPNL